MPGRFVLEIGWLDTPEWLAEQDGSGKESAETHLQPNKSTDAIGVRLVASDCRFFAGKREEECIYCPKACSHMARRSTLQWESAQNPGVNVIVVSLQISRQRLDNGGEELSALFIAPPELQPSDVLCILARGFLINTKDCFATNAGVEHFPNPSATWNRRTKHTRTARSTPRRP